jgi:ABC-2 type transport system permease protein
MTEGRAAAMAVHRRVYRPLAPAELTPRWSRFLVLPRFAARSWRGSRLLAAFVMLSLLPPLVAAVVIYVFNSELAQGLLGLGTSSSPLPFRIDGQFFAYLTNTQGMLAFLLVAWVGPGLVASDLANHALPLYLSRPFSRAEYVLGRVATLLLLGSIITWLPNLLLFALQAGLAGAGWWHRNLHLAWGIFAGSLIWLLVLALLALALSAWVRWRIVATGLYVGLFFVMAGLGQAFNETLRTYWGNLLNLGYLITTIWKDLFHVVQTERQRRGQIGDPTKLDIPAGYCWLVLLAVAGFCLLLLARRLRAREVVRG